MLGLFLMTLFICYAENVQVGSIWTWYAIRTWYARIVRIGIGYFGVGNDENVHVFVGNDDLNYMNQRIVM